MVTLARLIAALTVLLILAWHHPVLAQKGFYRVSGWEPDVKVFLNEEELREAAGQYTPGVYTLRVEKEGFHAYIDRVTIYRDQLVEIRIRNINAHVRPRPFRQRREARMIPLTGMLILTSQPPGEQVYLDSLLRGETPLVLENVPTGRNILQIGKASMTFSLRIFETVRLHMQDDKISNVTDEDLLPEQKGVQIEELALFMAETEEQATDCTNFQTAAGSQVFKLNKEGMFMVCRMNFRLPNQSTIEYPARFRLYRGNDLMHDVNHTMKIDNQQNRRLCYYHHDWWRPGEYVLTIDSAAGHRLAQTHFTIYF